MESILSNFPKRIDVWSVYVDALIKAELITDARYHTNSLLNILPSHLRSARVLGRELLHLVVGMHPPPMHLWLAWSQARDTHQLDFGVGTTQPN